VYNKEVPFYFENLPMSRLLESALGRLMPAPKDGAHGTRKLFTRCDNILPKYRQPNMTVTSPDLGPSGSFLTAHNAGGDDGDSSFPSLTWQLPSDLANTPGRVKEYLVVVEDLDVPLTGNILLGAFYGIPASRTSVTEGDFERVEKGVFARQLSGGFKFCPMRRNRVWNAPRPVRRHGPHRYHFQVVALNSTIDRPELSQFPTKESFVGAIEGKVVGWGEWVGLYEKK
jgi:phosphatidylethanolamine-binding protein (PEBP) family uncharacterized protein